MISNLRSGKTILIPGFFLVFASLPLSYIIKPVLPEEPLLYVLRLAPAALSDSWAELCAFGRNDRSGWICSRAWNRGSMIYLGALEDGEYPQIMIHHNAQEGACLWACGQSSPKELLDILSLCHRDQGLSALFA